MKYRIIFSTGYTDDLESLMKELRGDVLLLDESGNYYDLMFLTLSRIKSEFGNENLCYLGNNMIILHKVTKENILKTIPELHRWLFYKRWAPLSNELLEKYYFPKEDWEIFEVDV